MREECGVFAVSRLENAAEFTFLGLYALQHRGQESAGIVAVGDDGETRIKKGMGLVAEAIKNRHIRELPGSTAIGHVRYSTSGESELRNAQPAIVSYRDGKLALAHNGNLTNASELRTHLVEEGAIFQSTMDSEVIVHLIARSRLTDPDDQVIEALEQVEGAFSILILVNDTIYAARDSRGFRPLVLGRKGPGIVLASETCALDLIEAEYIRDIEPGEVLKIKDGRMEDLRRLTPAVPASCIFELVYFARPDSRLWGCAVDHARRAFRVAYGGFGERHGQSALGTVVCRPNPAFASQKQQEFDQPSVIVQIDAGWIAGNAPRDHLQVLRAPDLRTQSTDQKDRVALGFQVRSDDVVQIVDKADHSDDRRGVHRPAGALVVERNVAARDRRP